MIKVKLSDICEIQAGGTPSRNITEYWTGGEIPWVKIGDLKEKYVSHTQESITDDGLQNSSAKLFPKGTILYSIFATLGEVAILNIDAATNQAIAGLIIKDNNLNADFLYYYLISKKKKVNEMGRGVAQNNINLKMLRDFEIELPSLSQQKNTVDKFNHLLNLIQKRKNQLEKLDLLAKAKFYEMFGCAKNGNVKGKLVPIETVAKELFAGGDKPSDFSAIQTAEYPYPVFSNGERDNGLLCFSRTYRVGEKAITISARGTIGFITIRDPFFTPVVRLITFIPNDNTNIVYLKHCFMQLELSQTGTSQGQLTVPDFKKAIIPLPPIELQNEFAHFVEQAEKIKSKIKQSLEKLELLKQSLLQKYFG